MDDVVKFMADMNAHLDALKYTFWAVELRETGELIGFIGLKKPDFFKPFDALFMPTVEIGWRLGSQYWGKGYAIEGAYAAAFYGFNFLDLQEIVAYTVPANVKSRAVMERIGMKRDFSGDFAHPNLPTDHPLSQHVLYRAINHGYEEDKNKNRGNFN